MDNEDEIFLEFCLQVLGFYSQRATEYLGNDSLQSIILKKQYQFQENILWKKKFKNAKNIEDHLIL